MNTLTTHIPVLLQEAVAALVHRPDGSYVDGTFGRGGHSRAILAQLGPGGRLLAYDKDPQAIAHAQAVMDDARFEIRHASFADMRELPAQSVDGILLDLGVSSPQIDTPQRGFSTGSTTGKKNFWSLCFPNTLKPVWKNLTSRSCRACWS